MMNCKVCNVDTVVVVIHQWLVQTCSLLVWLYTLAKVSLSMLNSILPTVSLFSVVIATQMLNKVVLGTCTICRNNICVYNNICCWQLFILSSYHHPALFYSDCHLCCRYPLPSTLSPTPTSLEALLTSPIRWSMLSEPWYEKWFFLTSHLSHFSYTHCTSRIHIPSLMCVCTQCSCMRR